MGSFDTATLLLIAALVVGISALLWIALRGSTRDTIAPRSGEAPALIDAPVTVPQPKPKADLPAATIAEPPDPRVTPPPAPPANLTAIRIPAAVGAPDNLLLLKGVGPKLGHLLAELGVTRFDQIAAWGRAEIDTVDAHLGAFKGRINRDNWIEQAGYLARGEIAAFEAKFGKLDGTVA